MIQLSFMFNREILNFLVVKEEVFYTDRKWKHWVRCLPPPENFVRLVKDSRNRIPAFLTNLFKFTDEEKKEYEEARTKGEETIAQVIIKDAQSRGCRLVKKQEAENKDEEKTNNQLNINQ